MAEYQRRQQQELQIQQRPGQPMLGSVGEQRGLSTQQILAVVTMVPLGGFLLLLAGLTLAGTVLGMAVSAPVFLLFSPVLVPAALSVALAVAGFLTSGAFGVTGLSSLSWLAGFVRRMRLSPETAAEMAKRRAQEAAGLLGQKTKEAGEAVQSKAQAQEGTRAQETKRT